MPNANHALEATRRRTQRSPNGDVRTAGEGGLLVYLPSAETCLQSDEDE